MVLYDVTFTNNCPTCVPNPPHPTLSSSQTSYDDITYILAGYFGLIVFLTIGALGVSNSPST